MPSRQGGVWLVVPRSRWISCSSTIFPVRLESVAPNSFSEAYHGHGNQTSLRSPRDDIGENQSQLNPKLQNSPTARKQRSWKLLTLLAMLAALVWLLPSIVTHTPLLPWGIKLATAPLNGSVTVGSASLGWFSPVVVQNVEVKDAQGKPVLALQAADINRSLTALLLNYTDLGQIRLVNPKMTLVLRDDGSNVEDLLAKYLTAKENNEPKPSSSTIGLSLEMIDGSLSVTDQRTGHSWQIEKVTAKVENASGRRWTDRRERVGRPARCSASRKALGRRENRFRSRRSETQHRRPALGHVPRVGRAILARHDVRRTAYIECRGIVGRSGRQEQRASRSEHRGLHAGHARACRPTWFNSNGCTPSARRRGRPTAWRSSNPPSIATWETFWCPAR